MKSVVLIAHGSRVEATKKIVEKYAEELSEILGQTVNIAYMEFNEPSLETILENLIVNGSKDILILPLFLFEGNHILKDIPETVEKIVDGRYDISVKILPSIGFDKRVAQVLADRVKGEV